jgi:hypothetical protein
VIKPPSPRDPTAVLVGAASAALIAFLVYVSLTFDLLGSPLSPRLTNGEVQTTLSRVYEEIREADEEIERATEAARAEPNNAAIRQSLDVLIEDCLDDRRYYNFLSARYGPESLRGSTLPDEVVDVPPTDCR